MSKAPKRGFRFSVAGLLTLVALVAGTLGAFRVFWGIGSPTSRPEAWPAFLGFAAFGWAYLAFVLHGGFELFGGSTIYDAQRIAGQAKTGMALAVLAGLATHLCGLLFGKERP